MPININTAIPVVMVQWVEFSWLPVRITEMLSRDEDERHGV